MPKDWKSVTAAQNDDSFDQLSIVKEMAEQTRSIFDRVLLSAIHSSDTTGSCLYGSFLLSSTLNRFARTKSIVCGGGPYEGSGLLDINGVLHGHYWVEGETEDGVPFVADITADQFGHPKAWVLPLLLARKHYSPGEQSAIDSVVKEMEASLPKSSHA